MNLAFATDDVTEARGRHADFAAIGCLAQRALHQELQCYPKPGLVSPLDSGSHSDMDASTFIRSIAALSGYFPRIAAAGAGFAPFSELRVLGCVAERRMLRATAGVNTHRGAIFHLGLLAAAAGALRSLRASVRERALGDYVRRQWGPAIIRHASPGSHGQLMARRYRAQGARREAASGFPHVFDFGLPALRASLARGADQLRATVQCFFTLLAELSDTNLLYRGGPAGLGYAQAAAREFLAAGGVFQEAWGAQALALHREFVARRLSPGGSADMLAAVLFVYRLQERERA